MDATATGLVVGGCLAAAACGFMFWHAYEGWARARRHKASIAPEGSDGRRKADASVGDRLISAMERLERELSLTHGRGIAPKGFPEGKGFRPLARLSGLEGKVSPQAFNEARFRTAGTCAAAGLVTGMLFSVQLSAVLAIAGAAVGFGMPGHAMRARAKERAQAAERHLPEMLDVVALGMRSGLPFDSSLRIYAEHFDTLLSRELENARVQWSCGLSRRDEALRNLASTYDSAILARVVETVVKSIRYGSSMVASLESDAAEARSVYQSQREERIAKAPVKMMIPTGVLILPAMLAMVLGPVLLELMQGGF